MITLSEYILKLSCSLAVLYLFYRIVLHRLTFYQWNRIYLLGYALLCFLLPVINIAPWLAEHQSAGTLGAYIPVINKYSSPALNPETHWEYTQWMALILFSGIGILLARLLLRYRSLRQMHNSAILWQEEKNIRLMDTEAVSSPFSFGNSIYVNRSLHGQQELERIVQHELVHVTGKHTIDLVCSELLCILNWYNPFAWLIRKAIRQNLEFIADRQVLARGYDRKEYQYLLLKVTSDPQYSIVNHFNIRNLKKRIFMMNKIKSASLNLTRFLFALPLLMIILLAFRSERAQTSFTTNDIPNSVMAINDTIPAKHLDNLKKTKEKHNGNTASSAVKNPLYIVNEVVMANKFDLESIPKDDIESVVVLKNQAAVNKYGTAAKNGAVEITILKRLQLIGDSSSALHNDPNTQPLLLIDGRETPYTIPIDKVISPDSIQSVVIIKDKSARDKYGDRGKNGVIEVTTKKAAK
jgi:beta-lactamase regulating signal transducer with metallopeptidase domain